MIILIDAGHGIETKGKRSHCGTLVEWEYNRRVANVLKQELDKYSGTETTLICPEDTDIPLKDRCFRVNKIVTLNGRKNTFLVSIHLNAFTIDKPRGWEIHTHPNCLPISDEYANVFADMAGKILPPDIPIRNNGKPFKSDFQILRDTGCPSVLTENLYMTNSNDRNYLLTERGFYSIVNIHFKSIMKILGRQWNE